MKTAAKEVEWEVLPPESKAKAEPLFRWLALLMDDLLRVPGTNFRFGLDPILGLIPGLGDTSSTLVSGLALLQAARSGMPKVLLARMALNLLVNYIVGLVPVVGDAFSFWFKANARNYKMLREHAARVRPPRPSDFVFVYGIIALLVLIVLAGVAFSFFLLGEAAKLLSGV